MLRVAPQANINAHFVLQAMFCPQLVRVFRHRCAPTASIYPPMQHRPPRRFVLIVRITFLVEYYERIPDV